MPNRAHAKPTTVMRYGALPACHVRCTLAPSDALGLPQRLTATDTAGVVERKSAVMALITSTNSSSTHDEDHRARLTQVSLGRDTRSPITHMTIRGPH